MTSDRDQLERKFAEFSDEELRRRWAAGHLTATAQSVAAAEAASRDLQLEPYKTQDEPEDPDDSGAAQDEAEYLGDWVLVARRLTATEAQILCSFLCAHGISATSGDTNLVQVNWLWEQALGGACVRVPKSSVEQARYLMAERGRGSFTLDESFDPGEPSSVSEQP